jgi:hypothetical protein
MAVFINATPRLTAVQRLQQIQTIAQGARRAVYHA